MNVQLANTQIYTAVDNKHYVCVKLTTVSPTPENIKEIYQILDYIPTLKKEFTVIVDTRGVNPWAYMKFVPDFLMNLTNRSSECVQSAELWIGNGMASIVLPILQPLLDTILCSKKLSIKTV